MCPVGCHRIGTGYGTESHWMLVSTFITHHTYGANGGQKNSTCLPNLIVERNLNLAILHVGRNTGSQYSASFLTAQLHLILTQATDIDVVSILKDTHLLRGDVAQDTNGKTWTWEWMASNQVLWHTHRATYSAHLILEQPLQWLAQLEVHLLRESTDIVMALNHLTRDVQALDAVRIDGTLGKPLGTCLLLSLSIENLHEVATDNLTPVVEELRG